MRKANNMELSAEEYQKLVMANYARIWDNFDITSEIAKKLFENVRALHDQVINEPDNLEAKFRFICCNSFLDGLTLGLLAVMLGSRKVD